MAEPALTLSPGNLFITNKLETHPLTVKTLEKSLWHNGDFLKFWVGETVSLYGTQITTLALPLTALLVFNADAAFVGWLRFAQLVPYLAFALLFGVWTDRVARRPLMVGANAVRMVLVLLVPVLHFSGHLSVALLVALTFAIGTAAVLFDVSWMSYIPHVVRGSGNYVEANAKLGVSSSSAEVAGPGIAGSLVGLLTAPGALFLDSASYLLSIVTLLLISKGEPSPSAHPDHVKGTVRHDLVDGLRWVTRSPILLPLAAVGFFCNLTMILISSMFVVYAIKDIGLTPTALGLLLSISAIGGLIGAVISRLVVKRFPLGRIYFVTMSAIFLGPLLIPFAPGPRWAQLASFALSFFVSYLGLGIVQVVILSLRQASTPAAMMGRMNAAFRTSLYGGGCLGGPVGGLIAAAHGPRAALVVAAIASALMLIPIALSPVSKLKTLPTLTFE